MNILPENLKFTIRSYESNEYTVRFHNLNDDKTIQFDFFNFEDKYNYFLSSLINDDFGFTAQIIEELSLTQNQLRVDVLKNKFRYRELNNLDPMTFLDSSLLTKIRLRPLEIRTFKIAGLSKVQRRTNVPRKHYYI